ncbi:MAG: DUF1697 domain-containing protein [Gemmatimonadota bacterium]|nr:DUF1697 domain-containing protein [Gemmatimonadota bacterium]
MATKQTAPVMHVALLRGINVGKAKRIAMADLRDLCTALGYGDVKTLLNSGNVVFSAPRADLKAAAKIERAIEARCGFTSRVVVVTASELDAIIDENPYDEAETNPSRFLVTVLYDGADRARLAALAKQEWGSERLGLGKRATYSWCPDGILESRSIIALNRVIGEAGTNRNWATIKKIRAMMHGGSAPDA